MTIRQLIGKVLICGLLEIAILSGARFTREEIENLLSDMHRVKVVHVVKKEDD